MKNFILIGLISFFLSPFAVNAQNCTADITSVKYTKTVDSHTLTFKLDNPGLFEINLYNKNGDKYLLDNSKIQPFGSDKSVRLVVSNQNVTISGIDLLVTKNDLSVILIRKDRTCEAIVEDLK